METEQTHDYATNQYSTKQLILHPTQSMSNVTKCAVPPAGWYCTRPVGHDGPCAAVPLQHPWDTGFTVLYQEQLALQHNAAEAFYYELSLETGLAVQAQDRVVAAFRLVAETLGIDLTLPTEGFAQRNDDYDPIREHGTHG